MVLSTPRDAEPCLTPMHSSLVIFSPAENKSQASFHLPSRKAEPPFVKLTIASNTGLFTRLANANAISLNFAVYFLLRQPLREEIRTSKASALDNLNGSPAFKANSRCCV